MGKNRQRSRHVFALFYIKLNNHVADIFYNRMSSAMVGKWTSHGERRDFNWKQVRPKWELHGRRKQSATDHKNEILGRGSECRQTLRLLTGALVVEDRAGHLELAWPVDGPRAVDVVLLPLARLQRCTTQRLSGCLNNLAFYTHFDAHTHHTNSHTHTHARTRTHTYTTRTRARTHAHTHARTHTYTTRTRARSHPHARTHTHTHSHTHTYDHMLHSIDRPMYVTKAFTFSSYLYNQINVRQNIPFGETFDSVFNVIICNKRILRYYKIFAVL